MDYNQSVVQLNEIDNICTSVVHLNEIDNICTETNIVSENTGIEINNFNGGDQNINLNQNEIPSVVKNNYLIYI